MPERRLPGRASLRNPVGDVEDADAAYARAKELDIEIVSDMQYNPMARMKESTVRDPNGYAIGVCQSDSA